MYETERNPKKKKVRNVTTVTLPVGSALIYEKLAEIAWSVENENHKNNPSKNADKKEFIDSVLQDLGKEAFLYSYTPSGEIGSGDSDYRDNPQTPRIAKNFYDGIADIVGPTGSVTKAMGRNTNSPVVVKNRMFRFKSSIINLVQVYLEAVMKDGKGQSLKTSAKNNSGITSFNYKKRGNETDTQWYNYLVEVEMNRYIRMFVATFYFIVVSDLFETDIQEMALTIQANDLASINGKKTDKEIFKKLKESANRETFVRKIRDLFSSKINIKDKSKVVGKTKKGQAEFDIFTNDEE